MSKTIGVIGGLGPAATVDFFQRFLAASDAKTDQDHHRLIIDNNPRVPDRNAAIAGTGPSPAPQLAAMAKGLEAAGADAIVMVCNAGHAFQREIEAAIRVPFLSMIAAAADAVAAHKPKSAGLLAVSGCTRARLYQTALGARGIEAIALSPSDEAAFQQLIYRIKANGVDGAVRSEMAGFAQTLVDAGAEAVIGACTEVPVALTQSAVTVPLTHSTDALVARALAFAREA